VPQTPPTVRVLLVDDDPDDRLLVSDLLTKQGKRAIYLVDEAGDLPSALKLASKRRYDVALVDYKLGVGPDSITGLDVIEALRKEHYRTPVVIITHHGDERLQREAMEQGAAEFLEKGMFTADLLSRTCLYAIGLQEKQTQNGGGAGVGVNIETLVSLTRDSVVAQTTTAAETSEMRREFSEGMKALSKEHDTFLAALQGAEERTAAAIKEGTKKTPKFKWVFDWIASNPLAAALVFFGIVLLILLLVVVLPKIDVDTIKQLRGVKGALWLPIGGEGVV